MTFDKKRHLIKVQGGRVYLPVSARLVWFRQDHPDWSIETQAVEINHEKQYAIFRARICDGAGKLMATATKKEDVKGFADYIEKAECVPLDTEILTRHGWTRQEELVIGEEVLAYNHVTDTAEWVPLQRIVKYEGAETVHLYNKWGFDAVCTPEHTWAINYNAEFQGKKYEYQKMRQTNQLKTGNRIVTACVAPDGNSPVTPDQAALMGWLVTDGGFRRSGNCLRGVIYQSKTVRVEEITALLSSAGITAHHTTIEPGTQTLPNGNDYHCLAGNRWHIGAADMRTLFSAFGISHEECLKHAIPSLTFAARQAMLDAMMAGDGSARGDFGKKRKPWVMPLFSLLCALQGISLGRTRYITDGTFPVQRLKKTRHTHVTNLKFDENGPADVWCPTTKHGTWYARFSNGFTTITGNTGSIGRALGLCGFSTDGDPDLDADPDLDDGKLGDPAHGAGTPASPHGTDLCVDCGKAITRGQATFSHQKYGAVLCTGCQPKAEPSSKKAEPSSKSDPKLATGSKSDAGQKG